MRLGLGVRRRGAAAGMGSVDALVGVLIMLLLFAILEHSPEFEKSILIIFSNLCTTN
jgi:hypothetical protein